MIELIRWILLLATTFLIVYLIPDQKFPRYSYVPPRKPWWWYLVLPSHPPYFQSTCGTRETNFSNFFQLSQTSRSIDDQDKDLFHKIFYSVQDGTYLEVGARNGRHGSNTRFFDICLGWKGVLIEADPVPYSPLIRNRPLAHHLSFSPTCADNITLAFASIQPKRRTWGRGLRSPPPIRRRDVEPIHSPCGSLTPVLTELLDGHVTLMSLNVQGAEPMVLKHLNWSRIFIEVFLVERWSERCPKEPEPCPSRDEVRQILEGQGYQRHSGPIYKSDLFIHPKSSMVLLDGSESKGRPALL